MNPIKPVYVAVAPDELHALNQVVETLNTKFAELGADLKGKTTLDRLFELAQSGLEMEELEKSALEDYGPNKATGQALVFAENHYHEPKH